MNATTDRQHLMDKLSFKFGPVTGSDFAPWAFGIASIPPRQLVLDQDYAEQTKLEDVLEQVADIGDGCWKIEKHGALVQLTRK